LRPLLLLLLVALPSAGIQGEMPISRARARVVVDSISHQYYQEKFALYPAYATSKGVHAYDSKLSDFGPRKVRRFIIQSRRMREHLAGLTEDSLDIDTWIDMKALLADVSTQIFLLESLQVWRKNPILYVDACTNGLYYLAARQDSFYLNPDFSARLKAIPAVLDKARMNLTEPIRLHCEIASASAKAFLPFLDDLGKPSGTAAGRIDAGLVGRARASLVGFAAYLDSIAPSAEPRFALGRDNLISLLNLEHMVDESPEEIEAYAQRILKESRARLAELDNSRVTTSIDTAAALLLTKEDLLGLYSTEADSAMAFLTRREIVSLPEDAPVRVVATPAFLRVLVPGYAYEPPGPFDQEQTGLLYVPMPESLDAQTRVALKSAAQAGKMRGITVHELYPGHHLQLVAANRNPSFTRKLQQDNFTAEGWALYCEEMMAEAGYFGPSGERRALQGIIFRAARAVVDVRLQTGQFSLAQAVDFMVDQTGAGRQYAESEVQRYAVDPTQPMSYLMGKRVVTDLRDHVRHLRGKAFDLKEFHDLVLSCGTIQPYLLRICVTSKTIGRK
jgi:uncharacterized protein (DUF885 family)